VAALGREILTALVTCVPPMSQGKQGRLARAGEAAG
jgi:hypothetical protein